jgi:thiol-disulfide isomerase/thioredoxin
MQRFAKYLFIAMASVFTGHAATAADLPRYKFQTGEELVYAGSSDFDFGKGAFKNLDVTTFWVTRQNSNGSWHLIFMGDSKRIRTGDAFSSTNETPSYGRMDWFPDGRSAEKAPKSPEENNYPEFFPLPADAAQAKSGWQFTENEANQKAYQVKQAGKPWIIESTRQGIFHDVYQMGQTETIYFDDELGLVTKIESKNEQGYGFNGHGTGLIELKTHTIRGTNWLAQLVADADTVDKAEAASQDAAKSTKTGANADTAKATARQALETASAQVQNAALRSKIKSDLANLDNQFRYYKEENDSEGTLLNKPAATWTTTDLDGQKHALEDYRGKVVALDFWYRGCGWCMRAMPQIKSLADQFRDQPVVILGMNTDQQDKDAKFVIDKLQLNYLTLHGTGIPEKYGVEGFPTFIIIDQKGVVRARHIGYSPTLGQEMGKTISDLLAENK